MSTDLFSRLGSIYIERLPGPVVTFFWGPASDADSHGHGDPGHEIEGPLHAIGSKVPLVYRRCMAHYAAAWDSGMAIFPSLPCFLFLLICGPDIARDRRAKQLAGGRRRLGGDYYLLTREAIDDPH